MPELTKIGDVLVVTQLRDRNPYLSEWAEDRADLLRRYRDGLPIREGVTFWHGPVGGGARLLHSPNQIDWKGMLP